MSEPYVLNMAQLAADMERVCRACAAGEKTMWEIKGMTGLGLIAVRHALGRAASAGRLKFRTTWPHGNTRPVMLWSVASSEAGTSK
jgi:hypothetical protein